MKTTKITIGRLFNLGSYEHVRYEITVELAEGDSAAKAITGLERILEGLKPERCQCVKTRDDLKHEAQKVATLKRDLAQLGEAEFTRRHGHFVGSACEYIARCESHYIEEAAKRVSYEMRCAKARAALDDLGATETWKDCKLDWQNDDDWEQDGH